MSLESSHRDHLKNNDLVGQGIVDAIIKQQDVFHIMHDMQNAFLGTLHNETASNIQAEHAITRREIIQEIRVRQLSGYLPL